MYLYLGMPYSMYSQCDLYNVPMSVLLFIVVGRKCGRSVCVVARCELTIPVSRVIVCWLKSASALW